MNGNERDDRGDGPVLVMVPIQTVLARLRRAVISELVRGEDAEQLNEEECERAS
jgi:hypothetical protein